MLSIPVVLEAGGARAVRERAVCILSSSKQSNKRSLKGSTKRKQSAPGPGFLSWWGFLLCVCVFSQRIGLGPVWNCECPHTYFITGWQSNLLSKAKALPHPTPSSVGFLSSLHPRADFFFSFPIILSQQPAGNKGTQLFSEF